MQLARPDWGQASTFYYLLGTDAQPVRLVNLKLVARQPFKVQKLEAGRRM